MSLVVEIEKLVFGGDGLARLPDGRVAFVPEVAPGERVRLKILREDKDYALAEAEEILSPSPDRRKPPCPYFGLCGGCQLQHLAYEAQVRAKTEMLRETLRRLGGLPEDLVEGVVPSPREFHYRHRLRFHVEPGTGALGFVKRRSHDLVLIRRCLLGEENLNLALEKIPESDAWRRLQAFAKRVKIEASPAEGLVTLLFWITVEPSSEDVEALAREIPGMKSVFYWVRGPKPRGPFPPEAPHGGRRLFPVPREFFPGVEKPLYLVRPGVFTQANWEINLRLMKILREVAGSPGRVLDLHAGMGNFLFPLASLSEEARGVDTDPGAIADGRYTAEYLGLAERVTLERISATEALIETWKAAETWPLVLLDPPRGGCRELLRYLPEVATERIVYISCDPPTLARDLKLLLAAGYEVERILGLDMFPQTYHLEVLTLLRRRS
ncbi:class I SAM-dependent RNA methyltransferase [Thermosulfurimonas marina]|uniref:Class I SAM-dependent RNA methyltransferase n=1 Tax=Thermosulfurimonas marina TaxID=2047767 RepID=A0A6H1WT08_9BACT|nr:class I SAM-dependent RNA methyltransferase [Thermosulfurimonas marina]QJA06322.1 class I SAM-dependent RNA methyltransferase [Thermosulfurimonas marina]